MEELIHAAVEGDGVEQERAATEFAHNLIEAGDLSVVYKNDILLDHALSDSPASQTCSQILVRQLDLAQHSSEHSMRRWLTLSSVLASLVRVLEAVPPADPAQIIALRQHQSRIVSFFHQIALHDLHFPAEDDALYAANKLHRFLQQNPVGEAGDLRTVSRDLKNKLAQFADAAGDAGYDATQSQFYRIEQHLAERAHPDADVVPRADFEQVQHQVDELRAQNQQLTNALHELQAHVEANTQHILETVQNETIPRWIADLPTRFHFEVCVRRGAEEVWFPIQIGVTPQLPATTPESQIVKFRCTSPIGHVRYKAWVHEERGWIDAPNETGNETDPGFSYMALKSPLYRFRYRVYHCHVGWSAWGEDGDKVGDPRCHDIFAVEIK